MEYFFSPSKLTFYPGELRHRYDLKKTWPDDAFLVSAEVWAEFSQLPPDGMQLAAAAGSPAWAAAAPLVLTRDETLAKRMAAYRAESDPLKLEADYNALVASTEPDYNAWVSRVAEIKVRYPLPG